MKIIDRYILFSFLRSFLSFFFILMLIFIIQTVWVFIDEFAGKELDTEIVLKFLLYYSPKLVPLVLPLTVLLASIITFGNFSENYEFAAIKSAGMSLKRAMRSLFIFIFLLSIGAFYFANNVIPFAEFKTYNLRKNLAKMRPALAITEGIFNDLGKSTIKVGRKHGEDSRFLEDIIIHEKTPDEKKNIVIKAETGELKSQDATAGLQLLLFNGYRYEEIVPKGNKRKDYYPHARVAFQKYTMNIDLSDLYDVDFENEQYTNTYRMQNSRELRESIDSLRSEFKVEKRSFSENFYNRIGIVNLKRKTPNDSLMFGGISEFLSNYERPMQVMVLEQAKNYLTPQVETLKNQRKTFVFREKVLALHGITLHNKYVLAVGTLVLFLVGAPLGALIRKGGFGLPTVVALTIFLGYHFLEQFTKNWAEDGSISALAGSWIPTIILIPIGLYLVSRASSDKAVFDPDNMLFQLKEFIRLSPKFFKLPLKTKKKL